MNRATLRIVHTVWLHPMDEDIVDFGLGTEEDQRAAAARLEADRHAREAAWRALPWWTRAARRARARWAEPRRRLVHAWSAIRGIECEP